MLSTLEDTRGSLLVVLQQLLDLRVADLRMHVGPARSCHIYIYMRRHISICIHIYIYTCVNMYICI